MGKIITKTINRFDGGISDDIRQESSNQFAIAKHFDIYTYPKKLVPLRNTIADENDGSTSTGLKAYNIKDFGFYPGDNNLLGLGTKSDGTGHKVMYKDTPTSSTWSAGGENTETVWPGCFTPNAGSSRHFFFAGTNKLIGSSSSGSLTSVMTVALNDPIETVANGVTARDGNTYVAYNNIIVNATLGAEVLELPDEYYITSMDNYGNYLAIACAPSSSRNVTSKVFIWDLVSDDVTESIEGGPGSLNVIANIEGRIIGITDEYLNGTLYNGKGKLVIKSLSGSEPVVLKEIEVKSSGGYLRKSKAIEGGKLFFCAKIPVNASETYEGIWSFGRKSASYDYSLTLYRSEEDIDSDGIESFYKFGGYTFIAHSADGSVNRTNDSETYTYTSIYESLKFNEGDSDMEKKLKSVAVTFEPLPTDGQVVLKYRKDSDTSWTTIFTETTDNSLSRKAVNLASGAELPTYKEIQFRIESTGGAVITGFKFKFELLDSFD